MQASQTNWRARVICRRLRRKERMSAAHIRRNRVLNAQQSRLATVIPRACVCVSFSVSVVFCPHLCPLRTGLVFFQGQSHLSEIDSSSLCSSQPAEQTSPSVLPCHHSWFFDQNHTHTHLPIQDENLDIWPHFQVDIHTVRTYTSFGLDQLINFGSLFNQSFRCLAIRGTPSSRPVFASTRIQSIRRSRASMWSNENCAPTELYTHIVWSRPNGDFQIGPAKFWEWPVLRPAMQASIRRSIRPRRAWHWRPEM